MLLFLSLLLLPACNGKGGRDDTGDGHAGDGGFDCGYVPTDPALDAASPLGGTVGDWLALTLGSDEQAFRYTDGTTPDTSLSLSVSSTAKSVTAWSSPVDTAEDDDCDPTLEVAVQLDLDTADGAFAEAVSGTLHGSTAETGTVHASWDYAARGGSYEATDLDPTEWEDLLLGARVDLGPGGSEGGITLEGRRLLPDGTGEGFQGTIGTWPAEG